MSKMPLIEFWRSLCSIFGSKVPWGSLFSRHPILHFHVSHNTPSLVTCILQSSKEKLWPRLGKRGLMKMALSQFSFITHSQTLECSSMHSQCILKRWPCYLMEPKKIENHSKIIRKHLGNVFKCLQNVSMFLHTVCHVFEWEVTFWHLKQGSKMKFASS